MDQAIAGPVRKATVRGRGKQVVGNTGQAEAWRELRRFCGVALCGVSLAVALGGISSLSLGEEFGRLFGIGGAGAGILATGTAAAWLLLSGRAGLRFTEERLQVVLPDFAWVSSADGRCEQASPAWLAFTGKPEPGPDGRGWRWFEQVHPGERETVQRARLSGVSQARSFDLEFRLCGSDGSPRWFRLQAVPWCGSGSEAVRWVGFHTDIQESKAALELLPRSEERLRLATEAINLFFWDWDAGGGTVRWPENAAAIIGCSESELTSEAGNYLFYASQEEQKRVRRGVAGASARGERAYSTDFAGRGEPEKARYFLMHALLFYDRDGRLARVSGITQDVTRRKRANEQIWLQMSELALANQELTRFSRGTAGLELRIRELEREVNGLRGAGACAGRNVEPARTVLIQEQMERRLNDTTTLDEA